MNKPGWVAKDVVHRDDVNNSPFASPVPCCKPSLELAANLSRPTQTEEKLRRENVRLVHDCSSEREFALTF